MRDRKLVCNTSGFKGGRGGVLVCLAGVDASMSAVGPRGMAEAGADKKRPPPVKVLSGQLRKAEARRAADSGDVCYAVKAARGATVAVSLVWMQGTVLEAQLDRDSALLVDETGTFAVQGVNNIPKGRPCLSPGESPRARTHKQLFVSFCSCHFLHSFPR